jgi:hypothetical protein
MLVMKWLILLPMCLSLIGCTSRDEMSFVGVIIMKEYDEEAKKRSLHDRAQGITLDRKNIYHYDASIYLSKSRVVHWDVSYDGRNLQYLKKRFPDEKVSTIRRTDKKREKEVTHHPSPRPANGP